MQTFTYISYEEYEKAHKITIEEAIKKPIEYHWRKDDQLKSHWILDSIKAQLEDFGKIALRDFYDTMSLAINIDLLDEKDYRGYLYGWKLNDLKIEEKKHWGYTEMIMKLPAPQKLY